MTTMMNCRPEHTISDTTAHRTGTLCVHTPKKKKVVDPSSQMREETSKPKRWRERGKKEKKDKKGTGPPPPTAETWPAHLGKQEEKGEEKGKEEKEKKQCILHTYGM